MKMPPCLALLAVLWAQAAVAEPNLVQNGKPDELPSKAVVPKDHQQTDSGAYKYFLEPGSTALPHWVVTHAQIIVYDWSGSPGGMFGGHALGANPHLIDLHGAGGIEQEIATTPGQQYKVIFRASSQNLDLVKTSFNDASGVSYPVQPQAPATTCVEVFKATADKTRFAIFASSKDHYGPYITDVVVAPYDADTETARRTFDKLYRAWTDAFNSADFAGLAMHLTDDFSFHPHTGEALDRTAYLHSLQDAKANKGVLTESISEAKMADESATIVLDVNLYVTGPDGHRVLTQSRLQDEWEKQGDAWLLKSRTETAQRQTIEK